MPRCPFVAKPATLKGGIFARCWTVVPLKLPQVASFTFFTCQSQETPKEKQKTLDWEKYDPPSTLVVPEHEVKAAKFPFIDVHSHQWRMDEMDLNDLIRPMDEMNMGIMNNLSKVALNQFT